MGTTTTVTDANISVSNAISNTSLTYWQALADGDDGTAVVFPLGSGLVEGVGNPVIPTNAKMVSVTMFIRAAALPVDHITVSLTASKTGGGTYVAQKRITPATTGSSYVTMSPLTISGSDIDVNTVSMWFTRDDGTNDGNGYFLVSRAYAVFKWIRQPIVTVSILPTPDPSTNLITTQNRPTIQWANNLDPDGGAQFAYNVKVFTAAQYGAGGFDPETSDPLYETGGFSTSTFSAQVPDPLANGTYRAYVKTIQFNSNWSNYANAQFTLNVPVPGVPQLSGSAENDLGRNRLVATSTSGATTTSLFEFQYLDADSSAWKPMRTDNDVGWVLDNPATLYDYEAPNGQPQQYRVRAIHLFDFTTGSSSAWANATVTMQTGWWLKHPELPDLNRALEIASFNGQQRAARISIAQPLGRDDAVATMDSRGPETGDLGIRVADRGEVEQLQAITNEKSPLLLQAGYDTDEPDRWVVLGDETVERLLDNKAIERRNVTYAWTRVKKPSTKHHQTQPPSGTPQTVKSYTEEVQADGPKLWWRCQETGGTTLNDASGNNHPGTIMAGDTVSNADVSFDGSSLITEDLTKHSIYIHGATSDLDGNGVAETPDNPGVGFRATNYRPFVPGAKLTMEAWLYMISGDGFSTTFSGSPDYRACYPTTTLTNAQTFSVGQVIPTLVVGSTLAGGGQPAFPAASSADPTKAHLRIAATGGGVVSLNYESKINGAFINCTVRALGTTGGACAAGAAVHFGDSSGGNPAPTWEFINPTAMRFYADINTFPVGWVDWGSDNTGHPTSTFKLNQATHIACTYDDTTGICEWFVNGVSMGPQGPTASFGIRQEYSKLVLPENLFQFGHRGFDPDNPNGETYDGLVSEIAVYEKILPQSRIAAHFTSGTKNAGVVQPPPIIEPPDVVVDDRAFFGISPGGGFAGLSSGTRASQLTAMKNDGAKWVRVDIPWSVIQNTSSTDSTTWNWAGTDAVINAIVGAGLWVWGMIGYTPSWITGGGQGADKTAVLTTTNINLYATFCQKVAQRYGPANKCHVFEVWNEPNIGGFWNIGGQWAAGSGSETFLDANRVAATNAYANLLKAAYPKLKTGDPDCIVLPGGTSPAPDRNGVASWDFSINPVTWYISLYQSPRSCKAFMDALSHHPYHSPSWTNSTNPAEDWSSWRQMTGQPSPDPSIRKVMRNNSDQAKKIWIGEVGWPTRGVGAAVVTEAEMGYRQAVMMAEWKKYADGTQHDTDGSAAHYAGPCCTYTWQDSEDDAAANPDWAQHEGLIKFAGGDKPSRAQFRSIATTWNPP